MTTVKLAGIWELGWNTPIKEVDLWEYPLQDFGVSQLYMTPVSGIGNHSVTERATMEAVLAENSGLTVVFIDEHATVDLKDFTHPDNALYVFGKASLSAWVAYNRPGDLSVKITTPEAKGLLWPHQAACIVLYDRMLKSTT